ncbi:TolC family protein [Sphingobacterium multivorum]|uniref:TolC family protein n=1 Tax=Sphingobacterium multivorum TaxID=28454 RepID=UPI0031BA16D1
MRTLKIIIVSIFFMPLPGIAQVKLSLDNCLSILEEKNRSYLIIKTNETIDEQRIFQEKDKLIPPLNLSMYNGLLTGRSINPTTNLFENNFMFYQNFGLQTYYPILDWGRRRYSIRQNKFFYESSRYRSKSNLLEQKIKLILYYFDILKYQNSISITYLMNSHLKHLLQLSDSLQRVQKDIRITGQEIKVRILTDSINVINYEKEVFNKKIELADLLGMDYDTQIELVDDKKTTSEFFYSSEEEIIKKLNESAPDILAQESKIEGLIMGLKLLEKSKLPVLGVNIGISTNYSKLFDSKSDDYFKSLHNNLGGNAAIQINIPLYDQNQRKRQTKIARAELTKENLQLETLKSNLFTSVLSTFNSYKKQQKELSIRKANLVLLTEILSSKKELFLAKKVTIKDFLEDFNRVSMGELEIANTQASIACYENLLKIYLND